MKKRLITIIFGIILASCTEEKSKNSSKTEVEYIYKWNQVELTHTDDKYGEWGGDTDVIIVYSDGKKYYADYVKCVGSNKPPKPPSGNEITNRWHTCGILELKIDSIQIKDKEIELIEKAIIELTKLKINSRWNPTHSGIRNSVISRDSSLWIIDYPLGDNWESFQILKKSLTENNCL